SAALAAGWCTAWFAFPDHLDWFYTWAAVVLALASWRRRAIDHGGPIAALLLAKASGALTLAVISWTDGRTTDLALLVQAGVMLAANRRLHSRVLGLAAGLVWGVSLAFWIDRVDDERLVWGTIRTMMTIAYGVGATIWLLEAARALRAAHAELAQLARQLAAVVGGGLAIVAALWILPAAWLPSRFVVAALILMLIGRLWGSVAVLGAGGVVLLAAHLAYWFRLAPATELEAWINLGAVLPPTLVVAILLGRRVDAEESDRRTAVVAWTISAWAIVTSIGAAWKLLDDISALAVGGLLAAGLALSAPRRPRRGWMWLMAWTVAVGTTAFALSKLSDRPVFAAAVAIALWFGIATLQAWPVGAAQLARESRREWPQRIVVWLGWMIALVAIVQCADVVQPAAAGGLALVAVALLTWSWVGGLRFAAWALWSLAGVVVFFDQPLPLTREIILLVGSAWAPVLTWGWWSEWLEDREERGRPAETTLIVQSWLAALLAIVVVQATSSGAAQVFAFAGVAALIAVLNRLRLPRLLPVARVMALVAWLAAAVAVINGATHEWSRVTQAVFTTAALLVVLPFVLRWPERESDRWTWLQAGLGLALAFIVALAQTGQLEPYTTVAWGAVALVCFVAGVLGRSKPHRLLGLLGVLFCIPRVFLVDLQSTLYRIVAFAVLGLVLLWVGFSYHRFRRWITDTEDEATAGKD
ncbi:MAG TPA: hypothetical protein VHF69_08915, partial [Candidatus Synoicihabitans sp.]|nr:hypothetical protein [Candidatus Synoicihabitans sp.]